METIFLCLVNHGNKRGKARVFTYSLIDDGLFFSETSGARLKDCNSKHIVHARGNKSVRCAGTLRICHSPDRGFVLVFDNDSGTYQPRRKALELMDAVLARNFPELETLGLDVTEVQPQETMTWSGPDTNVQGTRLCLREAFEHLGRTPSAMIHVPLGHREIV